jgi:transcriptional regulator with XRE-family HTH domain
MASIKRIMSKNGTKTPIPFTKLAAYLNEQGLSQEAFGNRIGVSQGAVYQWLIGENKPSLTMALKIEAATNGKVSRFDCRPEIRAFVVSEVATL